MIAESYVPSEELRERRALVRGRKRLVEKRTDFKNEVHALRELVQLLAKRVDKVDESILQ